MTSLKNRLPIVAIAASIQQEKINHQADGWPEEDDVDDSKFISEQLDDVNSRVF